MMRRVLIVMTFANAALLAYSASAARSAVAAAEVTPVLRARALELVDDHGRVRAELKVLPAQPDLKMDDGTVGYPETVLLRLISAQGAPHVKLATTEDGSALVLGGDKAYVQILSRGANPLIKILNKDGRERTIRP